MADRFHCPLPILSKQMNIAKRRDETGRQYHKRFQRWQERFNAFLDQRTRIEARIEELAERRRRG